jgi:hypothetical protein
MNVEIGAEAGQFTEKEYINGIAVAVCMRENAAPVTVLLSSGKAKTTQFEARSYDF